MKGILLAKWKTFIRGPWTFLIFTGMSIVFALLIGGSGNVNSIQVPIYAEDETMQSGFVAEKLKEVEAFSFNWMDKEDMENRIANGKAELGLILESDSFQIIIGVESPNIEMLESTVQGIYVEKIQQEKLLASEDGENVVREWKNNKPVFELKRESFRNDDTFVYDQTFQSLFGFTLFFVIYTIAYNVLPILTEKKEGIWDRVILSPVRKWEMYVANLIYSFLTGYFQIMIIFLVFRFGFGVDFNGNFLLALVMLIPYVFAIVSLAILITAIVKNVAQFNAAIPIVSVSSAMIGGAYWPLEIVESEFMLALAKINPITYGMEVLNGIAVYGYSMSELLLPVSILLLMGVLMMGIGIHLMERRHI
ncbi:ABC transporter permease [Ornithinibacillus halophilus]|uniref:ABC-2 type transport system permease protein n=1 Tax=Ornithinibacillus halophilus TaxID=930117 RepID=A0A1M5M0G3_9BACI|nr:ABC transporter permease [Ornithinibacillus halophilus]SHG70163.1 ABC-2 type transport system permease protein [Ornithinibacillus halophilus]